MSILRKYQKGGPVKPYKAKDLKDYQYRKAMYEDSLAAYQSNNFDISKGRFTHELTPYVQGDGDSVDYWPEVKRLFNTRHSGVLPDSVFIPSWEYVYTDNLASVYKKPTEPVERPTVDSLPVREQKSKRDLVKSTSYPYTPTKPYPMSPRQQTILTWNPELKKHDEQVRVQEDAFIRDKEGWLDNSQPVVYHNPRTGEYRDKPFVFNTGNQTYKFQKGGNYLINDSGPRAKESQLDV